MTVAALFEELRAQFPPDRGGRMQRRVHPESEVDLFVAVSQPHDRRSLLLEIGSGAADAVQLRDDLRGVQLIRHRVTKNHRVVFELALTDNGASEIFSVLCEDVAAVAAAGRTEEEAVAAFLGRLAKWQHLLARSTRGLGPEAQRGLYSELWVLREQIAPLTDAARALAAWSGPTRSVRDFEGAGGALEVKSSIANQPQVATINGERQLDDSGLGALFLAHLALDVHQDAGETLPDAVRATRALAESSPASSLLEERLIDAGYLDLHEPLYTRQGYDVRRFDLFKVEPGFPRLIEGDLPNGVGGVRYKVAVAACEAFAVQREAISVCFQTTQGGEPDASA